MSLSSKVYIIMSQEIM